MAKPWEKYATPASQPQGKPWERYAQKTPEEEETAANDVQPSAAAPADDPSLLTQARHVAGGIPQAGFDILDLPSNMARIMQTGVDFLFGDEGLIPELGGVTRAVPALRAIEAVATSRRPSELPVLSDAKELLAKETVTREQAPVADALRTAMEWGAGGLPRAGQKLAGKAVSLAPDLLMGGAAGAGQLIGGDTGEMVGGLLGVVAAIRSGDYSKLTRAEQNALDLVRNSADDADAAMSNLADAIERGEVGTLADLTRDPKLYDIEKAAAQVDPSLGRRIESRAALREAQGADLAEQTLGGTRAAEGQEVAQDIGFSRANRITEAAKARMAGDEAAAGADIARSEGVQQAAEEAAEVATRTADEAADAVVSRARPSQVSTQFSERLDEIEQGIRGELETPAWEAFRAGPDVAVQPLKTALDGYVKKLVPEEQKMLQRKYGKFLRFINEWDGTGVRPQSVQAVVSQMKDAIAEAPRIGSPEKFLRDMASIIDETLENTSSLYESAKMTTQLRIQRGGGDAMIRARRKAEPEQFIRKLGLADENGAVLLRRLNNINDPQAKALIGERLRALALREGVDEKFMIKYGDILEGFPDMRAQLDDVIVKNRQALEASADANKAMKEQEAYRKQVAKELKAKRDAIDARAKKLTDKTENNLVGMYANAPAKTVKKLLNDPDGAPKLRRLFTSLRRQGGGEGFKASVRDELMQRYTKLNGDTGLREIMPTAYADFAKRRDGLVAAELLNPAEAERISVMLARRAGNAARKQAIAQALENPISELNRLMASGIAASIMGAAPGGHSLVMAGAVRRAVLAAMKRNIGNAELLGLEEFILNPEKFLQAAQTADSVPAAVDNIMTRINAVGQAAAATTGGQ